LNGFMCSLIGCWLLATSGGIRTHGSPSIAHDGTQVSLVTSTIDQLGHSIRFHQHGWGLNALHFVLTKVTVPMRLDEKRWGHQDPTKQEHHEKRQLLTAPSFYTF
jgi:hypothetical protein